MQWTALLFYSAVSVMQPTGHLREQVLPNWALSGQRYSLIESIEQKTRAGSPDYVRRAQRAALFVGDGVLWDEHLSELLETRDPAHTPDMSESGIAYTQFVKQQLRKRGAGSHGRWSDLAYVPAQELVTYLRQREFSIWVISLGNHEVDRVMAEKHFGVERSHVIALEPSDLKNANLLSKVLWERIGQAPHVIGRPHHISINKESFSEERTYKPLELVLMAGNAAGEPALLDLDAKRRRQVAVEPSQHWISMFARKGASVRHADASGDEPSQEHSR